MLPGIKQFDLSGRSAIVTGGSKGLGEAMAAGLASAGANVLLTSRNQEEAESAAAAIQRQKIALRRRQRAKSGSRPRGVVESNANDRQYRRRTADRLEGLGIHNVLLLFGGCGAGGRRRRRA